MSDLIACNGWTHGVELGVWEGALFGHLLNRHPDLYLAGVDHWRPEGLYAEKDMAAAEAKARAIAEIYPRRARLLKCDTRIGATDWTDGSLDFVFIDASHDKQSVRADVRAWRPKIRRGARAGALTGHDANLETVREAIDEELPGWKLLGANVWIFPFG